MRKLKATVDIYVDIVDNMSEEDALELIQDFIEYTNQDYNMTGEGPCLVNPQFEIYED
jgi:hypothetical protein